MGGQIFDMLKEAIFNFASDTDYHNYPNIITFAIGDFENYRREGNTHGRLSHALKHLSEFKKPFVIAIVNEIRDIMYEYASEQIEIREKKIQSDVFDPYFSMRYFDRNVEKDITVEDILDYVKVPNSAILNYLDLINDDYQMGNKLSPFAKVLYKLFFKRIEVEYSKVCDDLVKNAVDLDRMPTINGIIDTLDNEESVHFSVIFKNHPTSVVLNLSQQALVVIGQNSKFNSAYKLNGNARNRAHDKIIRMSREEMVYTLLTINGKFWTYRNPRVKEAFRKFANVQ